MGTPSDIPGATLDLNFMIPGTLPSGVVFTRASTGTYLDINGLLQTAAINAPRWDYDPAARTLKGVLIEEARTNAALQSGDFTNASWLKNLTSLNTTPMLGPNGPTTGVGLITNAGATGYLTQSIQFTAGVTITWSCFLKAAASSSAALLLDGLSWNDATNRIAVFNLSAGQVSSTTGGGATSSIYPVGNGWYRCSITATPDLTALRGPQIRASAVGDGVSTQFWAFGAQFEAGAFMTSYVPTTTAAVTRAADVATMPLTGWFTSGVPASFAADVIFQGTGANPTSRTVFQTDDNSNSNRYLQYNPANVLTILGQIFVGNSSGIAPTATTSISYGSVMKLSASYTGTSNSQCANGGLVDITTHALGFPPGMTTLRIGSQIAASTMGGWMRRHSYWPRALTDAELILVTSDAKARAMVLA